MFFLAVACFQLYWAALTVPFGNAFLSVAGVWANLGFLGLWGLSRSRGVSFGPHTNVPEAVEAADALTAALELAVIIGTLWTFLPREHHGVPSAAGYRFAASLAALTLGVTVMPGVSSALNHGGDGHSHEETGDGHDHDTETVPDMDEVTVELSEPTSTAGPDEEEGHTHAPGEEHE
ncbi:hypothetical protein [Glycomyces tenuis]|nr:hypothetical protein [Glycomyces tenuis]